MFAAVAVQHVSQNLTKIFHGFDPPEKWPPRVKEQMAGQTVAM